LLLAAALAAPAAVACHPSADRAGRPPATDSAATAAPASVPTPPPIRHVFVIVLENEDYAATFGAGARVPYLAGTLVPSGALLRQYYATAHNSLPNYIAMISGIAPTRATQGDCPLFENFTLTGTAPDGQPVGRGCVYPAGVATLANQLAAKGLTWKAYMEDMGNDPTRESATCGHPRLGAVDVTEHATPRDQYAAKHDPFVYFHAIVDSASCAANVVPLARLEGDLASAASTPNFAFLSPNLCHDGHDERCASGERPGGMAAADRFLARVVPAITGAPAFKDGLLIVTFDEAGEDDASACCDEPPGPNTARPGISGPGGGRTGAVMLSPFIRAGTVSDVPYNHYALLRSIERIFGLPYLGYAGRAGLADFGADVYGAPAAAAPGPR